VPYEDITFSEYERFVLEHKALRQELKETKVLWLSTLEAFDLSADYICTLRREIEQRDL